MHKEKAAAPKCVYIVVKNGSHQASFTHAHVCLYTRNNV